MSQPDRTTTHDRRKLRIMIAGEFSAGKTKLINGLVGHDILPTNVTATHLPPMWLVGGDPGEVILEPSGNLQVITDYEAINLEEAQFGIIAHRSPFLEKYDIIDTPGNSDPNIPAEYWERMLDFADVVIWCSNATQAWRQSEKSVWNEMPEKFLGTGTMLVTHGDLMPDERTGSRVMRRVQREARGYFDSILMVSLLEEDDIQRIRDHIDEMAKGIARHGAEQAVVAEFAGETRAAQTTEQETSEEGDDPEAAVLIQPAIPRGPVDPEEAPAPEEGAEIVPLKKERRTKPKTPRQVWKSLVKGKDLTDASAVMTCVEELLDHLETAANDADTDPSESGPAKQNNRRRARQARQRRTS